ncbi:hypothetical protein T484DRAFT_1884174, partial [Baffinella frigidus]
SCWDAEKKRTCPLRWRVLEQHFLPVEHVRHFTEQASTFARDALAPPAKSKKDKGTDVTAPRVALVLGAETRGEGEAEAEAGGGGGVEPRLRSLQVAARRLIQLEQLLRNLTTSLAHTRLRRTLQRLNLPKHAKKTSKKPPKATPKKEPTETSIPTKQQVDPDETAKGAPGKTGDTPAAADPTDDAPEASDGRQEHAVGTAGASAASEGAG